MKTQLELVGCPIEAKTIQILFDDRSLIMTVYNRIGFGEVILWVYSF